MAHKANPMNKLGKGRRAHKARMLGGNPTCEVLREGYKRLMGLCVWLVSVRAQKLSPSLLGLLTLHSLYILYIYIREREREGEGKARKIDGVCLSSHPHIALSFQI